jgi:hypothetical protein
MKLTQDLRAFLREEMAIHGEDSANLEEAFRAARRMPPTAMSTACEPWSDELRDYDKSWKERHCSAELLVGAIQFELRKLVHIYGSKKKIKALLEETK